MAKITKQLANDFAANIDYQVIKFTGGKKNPVTLQCDNPAHPPYTTPWYGFYNLHRRCPQCFRDRFRGFETIKASVEAEGYSLLTKATEYKSKKDKIMVQCNKEDHPPYHVLWDKWRMRGQRCALCSGNTIALSDMQIEAIQRGYTILSDSYTPGKPLLFQCKNSHPPYFRLWDRWKSHDCAECMNIRITKVSRTEAAERISRYNVELVSFQSSSSLTLKCQNCQTVWPSTLHTVESGHRCPTCFGTPPKDVEFIKAELAKDSYITDIAEYKNRRAKFHAICPKGHEFKTCWVYWCGGCRCPHCATHQSKPEKKLVDALNGFGVDIQTNVRGLLANNRLEIDLFFPTKRLGIEVCGLFHHSELRAGKLKHLEKLRQSNDAGIELLTIFEDELRFRSHQVESLVLKRLGLATSIDVTECECVTLEGWHAKRFLDDHSIKLALPNRKYFGLVRDQRVIAVLELKINDRAGLISNYCEASGISISGGFEKVFEFAAADLQVKSASFKWDRRLGLEPLLSWPKTITKPRPNYVKGIDRRLTKPKDSAKWLRIWDCGHVEFKWTAPEVSMKAHQKLIKERTLQEDIARLGSDIFLADISEYTLQRELVSEEIIRFNKRYEWLAAMADPDDPRAGWGVNPRWVFTARIRGELACIECLNLPNAFSKLLGPDTRKYECLIQRGASASFAHPHIGSKMIRFACRWMVQNTDKRLFVGYADSLAGEKGVVYRASNFMYIGNDFGAKQMCSHPEFKDGKPFSPQSLRRTALWKKLYKQWHSKPLPKEYLSPNGFKNIAKVRSLPGGVEAVEEFYTYGNRVIKESTKIPIPPKGKFVLVLGKDRREQRYLDSLMTFKPKPYPKGPSSLKGICEGSLRTKT